MLIRGQQRFAVVNLNSCTVIMAALSDGRPVIAARTGKITCELGYYDSPERCKEIIDDICEQYQCFVNFPGAEGNAVFQMPEE